MTNLWEFLLQTASVSLAALLLLFVKRLFMDKLTPRWQYGVWCILALRILWPVSMTRDVLLPLPMAAEMLKTVAEEGQNSAYAHPYVPLDMEHILPVYRGAPESIADWLFVVYGAGVILCLAGYLFSYIRLRLTLRHGQTLPADMEARLQSVCDRYGLSACRTVVIPSLPSAFVCGVFRPVLALPEGETDEKILLHELLHLRYRDGACSVFWCVMRCLHWCNPFLWWVFDRIGNDMESLCDTRVLERLEGEDRRAYGMVLLRMANERYARMPGTTSVSNGGKNIARRIEAIVRFRKYPRGMGLVSVCIALVLAFPVLGGTAAQTDPDLYRTYGNTTMQTRSLAMTRIHRCTTMAGAIDTYAKGLLTGNAVALANALPLEYQEQIAGYITEHGSAAFSDPDFAYLKSTGYTVFNLREAGEGIYEAWLAFPISQVTDADGEPLEDTDGLPGSASLLIPVQVWREGESWSAMEAGERIRSACDYNQLQYWGSAVPLAREMYAAGQSGTVTISEIVEYRVDNTVQESSLGGFFTSTSFNSTPNPDAQFSEAVSHVNIMYDYRDNPTGKLPRNTAGMQNKTLSGAEDAEELPLSEEDMGIKEALMPEEIAKQNGMDTEKYTAVSGSSSDGTGWSTDLVEEGKSDAVFWGSGDYYYDVEEPVSLPIGYSVMTFWDGEPMERFTITEDGFTVEEVTK